MSLILTTDRINALDAFIKAEKAGGRWNSHVRIYLTIWGIASANAICMKTLTSGQFFGGVTHGDGWVQGNGSTGYFNYDNTLNNLGFPASLHSLAAGCITITAPSSGDRAWLGGRDSQTGFQLRSSPFNDFFADSWNIRQMAVVTPVANRVGFFLTSRTDSTTSHGRWIGSTFSNLYNGFAGTAGGSFTNVIPVAMAGRYQAQAPHSYSDARMGSHFISKGFVPDDSLAFAANLINTFQNLTGLTIP